MADRIQLRRDTAAAWLLANPVLAEGEIGIEKDTKRFKIGDGVTAWSTLAYGGLGGVESILVPVLNKTGATISKMAAVYIDGAQGGKATVSLAQANGEATSSKTLGLMMTDVANNESAYAVVAGRLEKLDTSAFANGAVLWLSASAAGGLTTSRPAAPNHAVFIGIVANSHANQGEIVVSVQNGHEINELHDVLITSLADGQVLIYDAAQSVFKNVTLSKAHVGLSNVDNTSDADKPISSATQTALNAKQSASEKGQPNGYAALDVAGKVPAAQLPSYVDDVLEAADFAALPATGEVGKIYVTLDNGKIYRWSGSTYIEISPSPGSTDSVVEGSTNLYFTTSRVLATALAGLSVASSAAITSTDTVLTAFGKLQAQITALDGAKAPSASPTLSGNVTLSSGTANGVAYLNGSKVLTTGGALAFDGTKALTVGDGTATLRASVAVNGGANAGVGGGFFVNIAGVQSGGLVSSGYAASDTSTDLAIYAPTGKAVRIYANGVDAVRITTAGMVAVGSAGDSTFSKGSISDLSVARTTTWTTISARAYSASISSGGMVVVGKSRGTSVGSLVPTTNGDTLGYLIAEGVNASNAARWSSAIRFDQDAAAGVTHVPGRILFMASSSAAELSEYGRVTASSVTLGGPINTPAFKVNATASQANWLAATGAITGNPALLSAEGETNAAVKIVGKGTGVVEIGSVLVLSGQTVGTTVGAAGGASALPATPTGYVTVSINGTSVKIPYYTV